MRGRTRSAGNPTPYVRGIAFVLALVVAVLSFAGCGRTAEKTGSSSPSEAPPTPSASSASKGGESSSLLQPTTSGKELALTSYTLYVLDAHGYVVPFTARLPLVEGVAKQALAYLVEGGPGEAILPRGFHVPLPKGTTFTVDVSPEGEAVVDFSPEVQGVAAERAARALEAVVWTLTEFPTVKRVSLRVSGHPLEKFGKGELPVFSPLDRSMGINVELAPEATPGDTTAVRLYFQSQSEDGTFTYFVPVTRLVPRTERPLEAAIRELIRGPLGGSALLPTVRPSVRLHRAFVDGGVAVVDVDPHLLAKDGKADAWAARSVQALALTATEMAGTKEAQILVNGEAIKIGEDFDLTRPVARPRTLNPLGF
ncbi:MAG: GerMN domain-containing protein [Brockia lithotrophica]|nr:GerMN domain-containing protein [Brockia lithotrophica]